MKIDFDTTEYLTDIIKHNVAEYLDKYYSFFQENYGKIVSFYSGRTKSIQPKNFIILNELIKESEEINEKMKSQGNILTTTFDWELVEYFTDLRLNLYSVTKVSKFLRSSVSTTGFDNSYRFNYDMKQNQPVERISKDVLKNNNYNNDWVNIALDNNLKEVDYSNQGGNTLSLLVQLTGRSFDVRGIVANISGYAIYGLDLQRLFSAHWVAVGINMCDRGDGRRDGSPQRRAAWLFPGA